MAELCLIYRIISAFDDKKVGFDVNGRQYDYKLFPDFANAILDDAEKKGCRISTNCEINRHVR